MRSRHPVVRATALRQVHRSRALIIGSLLRVGMVLAVAGAIAVGTPRDEWFRQYVLLAVYGAAALWVLLMAFSRWGAAVMGPQQRLVFAIIDVAVLFCFQMLGTGGYFPLLVMGLLPLIVVPQLPWRRAAVVLVFSTAAFVTALLQDATLVDQLGWARTLFTIMIAIFLVVTALVVAYVEERHVDEITRLSLSREALLAETMAASDVLQRRISEAIHDGVLQDLIVARQDTLELAADGYPAQADRVLASLDAASTRLREAIFELHPVVVEQLGLGPAVEQVVSATAQRTGIAITTEADHPAPNAVDPIIFGVFRELLSNIVRHSGATSASVKLSGTGTSLRVEVADNGIGVSRADAAQRIAEGHIGIAAHRARVEAAGGTFAMIDEPVGTHVVVEVPLERPR